MLHGSVDEPPFVDALQHLLACRNEATLYDPETVPPGGTEPVNLLVIHAESAPLPPIDPLPWRIHLCLNSADFDKLLVPPADVRLVLYPKGALQNGWKSATPSAAYSGALTGLNLTSRNPRAAAAGTPAEWTAANFAIVESGGVLVVAPDSPLGPDVTTQAVFYVNRSANPQESVFSEKPKMEYQKIRGKEWWTEVDSDMAKFFQKDHHDGSQLLHLPAIGRRPVFKVLGEEMRDADYEKLRSGTAPDQQVLFMPMEESDSKQAKRHPFIVRAKYRLPDAK